jgi:hypothetical protein
LKNIIIKSVESGAQYQNHIYDFWLTIIDNEGCEHIVFDNKPYDLRKFIGKRLNLQVEAMFLEENQSNSSLILLYDGISDVLIHPNGTIEKYHVLKKKDVTLYVKESELPSTIKEKGKLYSIKIGRLDLLGFTV